MATGTITNKWRESFDLVSGAGSGHGVYEAGIVTIFCKYDTLINKSSVIATVPEQYRPSVQKTIILFMRASNTGAVLGGYAYVGTDGKITQPESETTNGGCVVGVYEL